jgi:outer membrane protein assembly factor BamA
MRSRAQIVVLSAVSLVACSRPASAQQSPPDSSCQTPLVAKNETPDAPQISIVEVSFSGSLQIPVAEQEQVAESIKQKNHGKVLERVVDEALERARAGWQDLGYFKVQVRGDAKILTSSPVDQRIALSIHVDEGSQYTLHGISFKNNRAISNNHALRSLFPIRDGEIFSREKIATGLENLRKAYGQFGYLNFTSVPDTKLDEAVKRISLTIDVDEGRQFYLSEVEVLGLDESGRQAVLNDLPLKRGQIYNSRLWELVWVKYGSRLPDCECRTLRRLEEKAGSIAMTLDFRPCATR